jgi:hypothetical protein
MPSAGRDKSNEGELRATVAVAERVDRIQLG